MRRTALVSIALALLVSSARIDASRLFSQSNGFVIPQAGTGDVTGAPASFYPNSIAISGMTGTITHMRLSFHITHAYLADVDIVLVAPTGQAMVVMSDVGGGAAVNDMAITLSDSAASALPSAAAIQSGVYRPANYGNDEVFPAPAPASFVSAAPAGSATFASTFGGLSPNGVWKMYIVDDSQGDTGSMFGTSLSISTTTEPDGVPADFDRDGISDWSVARGLFGNGPVTWYTQNGAGFSAVQWGNASQHDTFTSGDFDGDGRSDLLVCGPLPANPSAPSTCYERLTQSGTFVAQPWGLAGDNHYPIGDFDGDGRTDLVAYRDGTWYALASASKQLLAVNFGTGTDDARPADVDGDGRTDYVVMRQTGASTTTYMLGSKTGFQAVAWGLADDVVTTGDYDGDGKADIVAIRAPHEGDPIQWYIRRSSDGGVTALSWGVMGTDVIAHGDYDGDGTRDVAIYRVSEGTFYVRKSSDGSLLAVHWGLPYDIPTAVGR